MSFSSHDKPDTIIFPFLSVAALFAFSFVKLEKLSILCQPSVGAPLVKNLSCLNGNLQSSS